jgi:LysM repeat protein
MGIIAGLIPLFLFLLAFAWGLWLIFRKGDMVSQPIKLIGYFAGALLALAIAGFLVVVIFPAWADQLLGLATKSSSVQSFQQKIEVIFQQQITTPTPTLTAPPVLPTTPNTPVSGQSFTSPSTPAPGQVYIVQKGDTLYSIARKFGVTPQSLQTLNNISDPTKISVGTRLIISR